MPPCLIFTCTSRLEDLRFEPVEITRPPWALGVERLRLEVDDAGKLTIHCEALDPQGRDEAEAQSLARETVEQVLDRLALNFGSAVAESRLVSCQVYSSTGDDIHDQLDVRDSVTETVRLQPERVTKALSNSASLTPRHRLYRLACVQTDPTTRFLLLYQLLLLIHRDSQKQVDEFILARIPGTPHSPGPILRPGASPRSETVYTRLRNELAHVRKGSDGKTPVSTAATIREVEQWVGQLQDLVRAALEIESQADGGTSHP